MKLNRLVLAGLLMCVSGAAVAKHGHDCGQGTFDPANWQAQRLAHFEQHQQKLHTILQLTSTQEHAWKTYQAQIKPQTMEHPDFAALSTLNTLQRLDKIAAWDQARDTRHAEHAKAVRTFYAQLNDAQKKAFDENALMQQTHHAHTRQPKPVRE